MQHRQVGHERKRLEHHGQVFAAQGNQGLFGHGRDVLAAEQDLPMAGLDQAVEQANQGGLAGARQAHEHKNLALVDGEIGVSDADHHAGLGQDVVFALASAQHV